jgi:carboxypeptidase Q
MKIKYRILLPVCAFLAFAGCSPRSDQETVAAVFKIARNDPAPYQTLKVLCEEYPNRLGGTPTSIRAIQYMKRVLEKEKFDSVYLQECTVAHWDRGAKEIGAVFSQKKARIELAVCALGNSVGTPAQGITAGVIEVHSFAELKELGEKSVKGKIVFFNRAMDAGKANPFEAYGEVVGFRFAGASAAARYGAEAMVVRSITTAIDGFPHTGVMRYKDTPREIPAFAVASQDADRLSALLAGDRKLKLYLKSNCRFLGDETSYNVIGEVRGREFPDEIIAVGGHIDAWDISAGAHDDGGGCVQALEVRRIFDRLDYRPKRTLRVVLFMDEEMNQRGGRKYAEAARQKKEKHLLALESDGGCDKPRGFSFDPNGDYVNRIKAYATYFAPYGVNVFVTEGSGVDVEFLKGQCALVGALLTDPAHYFDYHHSGNDTFEHVDERYLQDGSAAMAALVYFVDRYGLK